MTLPKEGFFISVIHQTIFIKEMEQQAEDHTDQSRKGHPFQGDAAPA